MEPVESDREWARLKDAIRLFGIGRATLYSWIAEGRVKSACIRKKHAIRGIRLINVASLRSVIESSVSMGTGPESGVGAETQKGEQP
jgi:hypothetical protein